MSVRFVTELPKPKQETVVYFQLVERPEGGLRLTARELSADSEIQAIFNILDITPGQPIQLYTGIPYKLGLQLGNGHKVAVADMQGNALRTDQEWRTTRLTKSGVGIDGDFDEPEDEEEDIESEDEDE